MSERDNGGQVFPLPAEIDVPYDMGLTVRDWFAGQALTAMVARNDHANNLTIASRAYLLADAMLRERNR
jgi:hypothetical protein